MCRWEQIRRTGNGIAWRTKSGKTWGKGLDGEVYLRKGVKDTTGMMFLTREWKMRDQGENNVVFI